LLTLLIITHVLHIYTTHHTLMGRCGVVLLVSIVIVVVVELIFACTATLGVVLVVMPC